MKLSKKLLLFIVGASAGTILAVSDRQVDAAIKEYQENKHMLMAYEGEQLNAMGEYLAGNISEDQASQILNEHQMRAINQSKKAEERLMELRNRSLTAEQLAKIDNVLSPDKQVQSAINEYQEATQEQMLIAYTDKSSFDAGQDYINGTISAEQAEQYLNKSQIKAIDRTKKAKERLMELKNRSLTAEQIMKIDETLRSSN